VSSGRLFVLDGDHTLPRHAEVRAERVTRGGSTGWVFFLLGRSLIAVDISRSIIRVAWQVVKPLS
jgi:hypothetical protein